MHPMIKLSKGGLMAVIAGLAGINMSVVAQESTTPTEPKVEPVAKGTADDLIENDNANQLGRENAMREHFVKQADLATQAGLRYFQKFEYEKAVNSYLDALSTLEKCGNTEISDYLKQRKTHIQAAIGRAYYNWSQDLIWQASEYAKNGDPEKAQQAIDLLQKAREIYPACDAYAIERIARYEKIRDGKQFLNDISSETINPTKPDISLNIDSLMRQGIGFFNDHQIERAREKFEKVLELDPYNINAADWMRKVNRECERLAEESYKDIRSNRVTETNWKYVSPLIPRATTGNPIDVAGVAGTKKVRSELDQTLNDIIIDRVVFTDTPISKVLNHLKTRAKELDSSVTVNFVLKLPSTEAAAPADGETGIDTVAETASDPVGNDSEPIVNLSLEDVNLLSAITCVCKSANMNFKVQDNAILVFSATDAISALETRIYPIEPGIEMPSDVEELKTHLAEHGINFPDKARVVYDQNISRIIMTNTPDQLDAFEEYLEQFNKIDPQVLIETKFVEIAQNDLNELGFEWLISNDPVYYIDANGNELNYNRNHPNGSGTPFSFGSGGSLHAHTGFNPPITRAVTNADIDADGNLVILGELTDAFGGRDAAGNPLTPEGRPLMVTVPGGLRTPGAGLTNAQGKQLSSNAFQRNVNKDGIGDMMPGSRGDAAFWWRHTAEREVTTMADGTTRYKTKDSGFAGLDYDFIVRALSQCDSADVLSTPRITTMNATEAQIRMVTEVYYPTQWTEPQILNQGGGNNNNGGGGGGAAAGDGFAVSMIGSTPEFDEPTEIGIVMRVTPNVDADRYTINLVLEPKVQTFIGWIDYSYTIDINRDGIEQDGEIQTQLMPIIEARTIESTIRIYDGETLVIGGALRDKTTTRIDKVPFIADIPLIGRAFQTRAEYAQKTNLLIFLTCRLVYPDGQPIRGIENRGRPTFRH